LNNSRKLVLGPEVCGILLVSFAVFYLLSRVGYFAPSGGDISVWIFTHEWLSRGNTLYEGVWDHKDWGFFAITQPFYELAGIKGLYFAALLSVSFFAIGIFLLVRSVATFKKSVIVSFLAAITYTSSPSFLATYTENLSISLSVLALGLVFKYPVISGAVFALSVSVKISGILVFTVIFGLHSATQYFLLKRRAQVLYTRLAKLAGGFLFTCLLILGTTYMQGTLGGWMEVIDYNSEYGEIRRGPMPPISEIINFLKFSSPGDAVAIFLACLGLSTLTLCAFTREEFLHIKENAKQQKSTLETLVLAAGLTFSSLTVMIIQFPPSFQHWQYFVGGAISLISVISSILGVTSMSNKFCTGIIIGFLSPIVIGTAIAASSQTSGSFQAGTTRWLDHIDKGEEVSILKHVPPKSTIAFINFGSSLFNLNSLPDGVKLGCRHFYNFPHLLPRFGQEMLSCLKSDLNYVVLRKDPELDLEFQRKILSILQQGYTECKVSESEFQVWALDPNSCNLPN
jgi:hypothetical protein